MIIKFHLNVSFLPSAVFRGFSLSPLVPAVYMYVQ